MKLIDCRSWQQLHQVDQEKQAAITFGEADRLQVIEIH